MNWQRSDSYNYVDDLVRTDWTWDALRRNAQFRKSWLEAQSNFETIEQHGHLRVVGCFDANPVWNCLYTDLLECNATSASVIWRPEHYAQILPWKPSQDAGLEAARYSDFMT